MACSSVFSTHTNFTKALLHFLLVLHFIPSSFSQNTFEEKLCVVLHSEPNFEGDQLPFKDGDHSVNVVEDQSMWDDGWNTTGSLTIQPNCAIRICNESYFDGKCEVLRQGQEANFTLDLVASISCGCEKQCNCSDIHMKKSACARGYLAGGCQTCNSLYTTFINESSFIPEEFYGKVEALRLRKGCSLTTFEEENFEGEENTYEEEVVESDITPFRSYECTCNDDEYVPKVKPPRPSTFPPMIDIPTKFDDILKLLANQNYSTHSGLQAARNSFIKKRSSKNAYILLLGTTGSGKSSAINLLFDNPNVTRVGDITSTTTDIHEFRIPVPIDELGISNTELRVIDTPGLGDTRGMDQDAKFLATLENFLNSHEELKDRIPNVVLIFHKFNDNRFGGKGASFVKMIRGFDSFRERLTDENYSNVIFVLSHFCSETKATVQRPEKRLAAFKNVIDAYSLFPKPTLISVAENKGKDQSLPMVNGYFKLPNNEYYPRNLFEKLEVVTKKGGDMIGLGVFRTAFRDSEDFNVTSSTFRLTKGNSDKVQNYLTILTDGIFDVENTNMSRHLRSVWDEQVDNSLKKDFPQSLQYLQKILNLRNINTMDDVPRTTSAILELLTAIKHDRATRMLLQKALGLTPPLFPHNTIAGFSYNVFKDAPLSTSPFVMGDVQPSDIGFMLPKSLTANLNPMPKEHFHIIPNQDDYLHLRLRSLGIDGEIANQSFTGQIKPGHNIRGIALREDGCSLSAVREFRLFDIVVNDRLDLTPEFKTMVKGLPIFNNSDHENVQKWNNFFNEYGTHVVRSVHGGGSIEIRVESDKPFNSDTAKVLFDLVKFAEEMSFIVANVKDGDETQNLTSSGFHEGLTHSLIFTGGDPSFHTNDLTKMSIEQAGKLVENWKKSLKYSPSILGTEMRLIPISQIARKVGQNYSAEIERATRIKFNSSLIYDPPRKSGGHAPDRDNTPLVMMEMIQKMTEASEKRMENLMLEMKKAELANQEYQRKAEEREREWRKQQVLREDQLRKEQREYQDKSNAQREKWQREAEERRTAAEKERLRMTSEFQNQTRLAQEASDKRMMQLMKELGNRPTPQQSCRWYDVICHVGL